MKTKLSIVTLILLCSRIFCQYIYTPNGTPVPISSYMIMSYIEKYNTDTSYTNNFPNAFLLDSSIHTYNCHGYAWSMMEGDQTCVIDTPGMFWVDYSYVETNEANASKIYYPKGDRDHSAVKSSVSGYYESKWAAGPLMRHPPGYGPEEYYLGDGPKYYILNPNTITGPDEVCDNDRTFTLNGTIPPGGIFWTLSGDSFYTMSSPPSSPPNSKDVYYRGTGADTVTLYAHYDGSGDVINMKRIKACSLSPEITGDNTVCYSGSQFELENAPSGSTIYWTVSNTSLFTVVSSSGNPIIVKRIGTGTGNATLSARTGSVSGTVVATKTITACAPPVISGNYYICSSASYSLSSPHQADGGWTVSPSGGPFYISSQNKTSATVTVSPQNAAASQAMLIADVSGTQISIPIANCALLGSNYLCPTTSYYISNGAPAVWSVTSGFSITPYDNDVFASVTASAPNLTGTVSAIANGATYYMNITSCEYDVYGKSGGGGAGTYVTVRPNPASTMLIIEIDENAAALIRAMLPSNDKIAGVASPTYDVRLYNMSGELVRNEKTKNSSVNFDVSTLPNGFYFLHVYDGIIPAPEVQKVMVNH